VTEIAIVLNAKNIRAAQSGISGARRIQVNIFDTS